MSQARPVVACTIVTGNHLPAAFVLADSYLDHHPEHEFVVVVVDGLAEPSTTARYQVVGRAWLDLDEDDILRMATIYSAAELVAAVKPAVLRKLRTRAEVAIYLEADTVVYAPFDGVAELAAEHSIVLTPHILRPLPRDGKEPDERALMGIGIFNLGFVAVGPGSEEFLEYWTTRMRHDAVIAPAEQLFADHRWADQVPALFRHTVLRDPGYSVAYWNLHERPVRVAADGTPRAGTAVLRSFRFQGYRPDTPWLLTVDTPHRPRALLSEHPDLRALCDRYRKDLRVAGHSGTHQDAHGFARTPDGTVLTASLRHLVRSAWVAAEGVNFDDRAGPRPEVPPHPFGPDSGEAFRRWLAAPGTPTEAAAGLNRWSMWVWQQRPDLQAAFPRPYGEDAAGFREWCRSYGVTEGMLAPWAVPADLNPPRVLDDRPGVNLLGYLTGELGLGEMGRIVHDVIAATEVPVVSVVEERSLHCRTGADQPDTVGLPRYPVSLVCVNADQTRVVRESHPDVFDGRYRIGVWAWELEDFPAWQHDAFELLDEVWTISEFCRAAIGRHSPIPVKVIPVPVRDPGARPVRSRAAGTPTQFLFIFDFNSTIQRKNPIGLITAFRQAFPDRADVRLVIKAINGNRHPGAAEQLRAAAAADPRVELLEKYLTAAELDRLYADSDCYVSLHRSEGFGLTVAEAMARGMPVISTDYSGTAEFLDARVGWPIPYRMTTVPGGSQPYHEGAAWADPDLAAAAYAMREVAFNPAEAARRGKAARAHILATRSMRAAAGWIGAELDEAYRTWRERGGAAAAGPESRPGAPARTRGGPVIQGDALAPLRASREALHWQPDVRAESRVPLAPALRRAVLRALNHYDVHQRQMLTELVDGIETTLAQLLTRLDAVEARHRPSPPDHATAAQVRTVGERVDELQRELTSLAAGIAELAPQTANLKTGLAQETQQRTAQLAALRERLVDADMLGQLSTGLTDRIDAAEQRTVEFLRDRDRRADAAEFLAGQLRRDVDALHDAAQLRQLPVPATAEVVVCDAGVLLVPHDKVILPALRLDRNWEPAEAALLAQLAGAGTVLDVGAHVGYHSLRLLRECPGIERVIAVEANPDTVALLRRNLAVNLPAGVAERVVVLPVAAWDAEEQLSLVPGEAGNSGDYRVGGPLGDNRLTVPAIRLDGHPDVTSAGAVTLVKTDLQGRDHRAIAGLAGVIAAHHPHIVCEFWPQGIADLGEAPDAVLSGYRAMGYRPVPLGADGPRPGRHSDDDLIAAATSAAGGFLSLWLQPQ